MLEKQVSLEQEQHTVLKFTQKGIFAHQGINKNGKRKKFDIMLFRALFIHGVTA